MKMGMSIAMISAGLVGLAGCEATQTAGSAQAAAAGEPDRELLAAEAPEAPRVDWVVQRSALRERAIALLIEYAASNNAMLRGNSLEALSPAGPRLQSPLAAGLVQVTPPT